MMESTRINEIFKKVKPGVDFENVNDIMDGEYLDSFELIELISSLETSFNVEINSDYISPENFNSVDAIASLIEQIKK